MEKAAVSAVTDAAKQASPAAPMIRRSVGSGSHVWGKIVSRVVPPLSVFVFVVFVWEMVLRLTGTAEYLLPKPSDIVQAVSENGHNLVVYGIGSPLPDTGSKVLEQGSWGAALIDRMVPEPGDIRVDKYRISGFWDTPLDSILRNLDVKTLLFAGVNLDQCVMHTLQDAVCLGYDAILLEDCCATSSPAYCTEAALYNIKQCYGFVAGSEDLLQACTRKERDELI
ncbi:cysteine hydrolase family protein [Paenibacillus sp. AR247]|uniref:cysteine hydrolase family protein n=1 Tax=Paenibacillus sp. AR247 TaxID=1631599 RepID=UPI00215745FC|nr:cysteine hydrolase [Paenibacillus sp. AR247]